MTSTAVLAAACLASWWSIRHAHNPCGMTYSWPVFTKEPMEVRWAASALLQPVEEAQILLTGQRDGAPPGASAAGGPAAAHTSRLAHKYALYRFSNGQPPTPITPESHAILFVPGHGGCFKQIRSLAAATMAQASGVEFYALDFNEEVSALLGWALWDQAEFLNDAIATVLSKYEDSAQEGTCDGSRANAADSTVCGRREPKSVTVIGHSMGGMVARAAPLMSNYVPGSITTILTLGTPHLTPPLAVEAAMARFYATVNSRWASAGASPLASSCSCVHGAQPAEEQATAELCRQACALRDVAVLSISSGETDTQVWEASTAVTQLTCSTRRPASRSGGAKASGAEVAEQVPWGWLSTQGVASIGFGVDHLAILWCQQLVAPLAQALGTLANTCFTGKQGGGGGIGGGGGGGDARCTPSTRLALLLQPLEATASNWSDAIAPAATPLMLSSSYALAAQYLLGVDVVHGPLTFAGYLAAAPLQFGPTVLACMAVIIALSFARLHAEAALQLADAATGGEAPTPALPVQLSWRETLRGTAITVDPATHARMLWLPVESALQWLKVQGVLPQRHLRGSALATLAAFAGAGAWAAAASVPGHREASLPPLLPFVAAYIVAATGMLALSCLVAFAAWPAQLLRDYLSLLLAVPVALATALLRGGGVSPGSAPRAAARSVSLRKACTRIAGAAALLTVLGAASAMAYVRYMHSAAAHNEGLAWRRMAASAEFPPSNSIQAQPLAVSPLAKLHAAGHEAGEPASGAAGASGSSVFYRVRPDRAAVPPSAGVAAGGGEASDSGAEGSAPSSFPGNQHWYSWAVNAAGRKLHRSGSLLVFTVADTFDEFCGVAPGASHHYGARVHARTDDESGPRHVPGALLPKSALDAGLCAGWGVIRGTVTHSYAHAAGATALLAGWLTTARALVLCALVLLFIAAAGTCWGLLLPSPGLPSDVDASARTGWERAPAGPLAAAVPSSASRQRAVTAGTAALLSPDVDPLPASGAPAAVAAGGALAVAAGVASPRIRAATVDASDGRKGASHGHRTSRGGEETAQAPPHSVAQPSTSSGWWGAALASARLYRTGVFPRPPPTPALVAAMLWVAVLPTWLGPVTHAVRILVEPMRAETPRTLEAALRCAALAAPLALLGLRILRAGRQPARLAADLAVIGDLPASTALPAPVYNALRAAPAAPVDHSECPQCLHESGRADGAVVYEAVMRGGGARQVAKGVWLGPTFRVVECDCWQRLARGGDPAIAHASDVCEFCACNCATCGGNPVATAAAAERRQHAAGAGALRAAVDAAASLVGVAASTCHAWLPARVREWMIEAGCTKPSSAPPAMVAHVGGHTPNLALAHAAAAHGFALLALWLLATSLVQVHRLQVNGALLAASLGLVSLRLL
jgi:hypothetical protein